MVPRSLSKWCPSLYINTHNTSIYIQRESYFFKLFKNYAFAEMWPPGHSRVSLLVYPALTAPVCLTKNNYTINKNYLSKEMQTKL